MFPCWAQNIIFNLALKAGCVVALVVVLAILCVVKGMGL